MGLRELVQVAQLHAGDGGLAHGLQRRCDHPAGFAHGGELAVVAYGQADAPTVQLSRDTYPGSGYPRDVVREALTEQERSRGRALGVALRRARDQLTVRDLAQRCGLAQETIRKIERGAVPTPALFTVAALADALNVPLNDLVQEAVASGASMSRVDVA